MCVDDVSGRMLAILDSMGRYIWGWVHAWLEVWGHGGVGAWNVWRRMMKAWELRRSKRMRALVFSCCG